MSATISRPAQTVRRHLGQRLAGRGALARDLARAVDGEVRFDPGAQALYANDASIYRQVPLGAVLPRHAGDVVAALEVCRDHGVPVHARGCGTGLAGQSVKEGVVFDFSKYMNRILTLDPDRRTARVQPGVICDQLRGAAARHGLTFAVDRATHDRCTLGGMIGNNSCGTHSVMGGKTVDNVLEMDVVTYDGTRMTVGPTGPAQYQAVQRADGRRAEIYRALRGLAERYEPLIRARYPDIPRRVSGYNLDDLLPACGARGVRMTDPRRCREQLAEALAADGPVLVECVTDEHAPPYPAKVKKQQVAKMAAALREGTPNRKRIALQMVKDMLDESSFQASPVHAVPGPVGRAGARIAERPRGDGQG